MGKYLLAGALVSALLIVPLSQAHAGDREWATAGKILTGVVGANILFNGWGHHYYGRPVVVHRYYSTAAPYPYYYGPRYEYPYHTYYGWRRPPVHRRYYYGPHRPGPPVYGRYYSR